MTFIEQKIKEYSERFVDNKREDGEDYTLYLRDNDIAKFLREALTEAQQDILKRVEAGIPEEMDMSVPPDQHDFRKYRERVGFNTALTAVKELLATIRKESLSDKK